MRIPGILWGRVVLGIVCLLVGAVWALQGAGALPGSSMTGQRFWLVVGAIVFIIGIGLLYRGLIGRAFRRI